MNTLIFGDFNDEDFNFPDFLVNYYANNPIINVDVIVPSRENITISDPLYKYKCFLTKKLYQYYSLLTIGKKDKCLYKDIIHLSAYIDALKQKCKCECKTEGQYQIENTPYVIEFDDNEFNIPGLFNGYYIDGDELFLHFNETVISLGNYGFDNNCNLIFENTILFNQTVQFLNNVDGVYKYKFSIYLGEELLQEIETVDNSSIEDIVQQFNNFVDYNIELNYDDEFNFTTSELLTQYSMCITHYYNYVVEAIVATIEFDISEYSPTLNGTTFSFFNIGDDPDTSTPFYTYTVTPTPGSPVNLANTFTDNNTIDVTCTAVINFDTNKIIFTFVAPSSSFIGVPVRMERGEVGGFKKNSIFELGTATEQDEITICNNFSPEFISNKFINLNPCIEETPCLTDIQIENIKKKIDKICKYCE